MLKPLVFLLFIINVKSMAQPKVEGEYYFRKMEMASGFNFSSDGKFQFFYSYGAIDRTATGSFVVKGDSLLLKSDKEPGKDFTIISQSKKGNRYVVSFDHANKYLLKNIVCIFVTGGKQQQAFSDENGRVNMPMDHCDTIYVFHSLFPDVPTLIKDKNNSNNSFALTLNPSLEQVSFKDIYFKVKDSNTIECSNNYFIDASDIKFQKE
jgi:hypothetical protein